MGLHYNRYRYYDPEVGRFVSKDSIGFTGGLNVFQYTPNPIGWLDPLSLAKRGPKLKGKGRIMQLSTHGGKEFKLTVVGSYLMVGSAMKF